MVGGMAAERQLVGQYMDERFNRRTFAPESNASHKRTLETLRQHGSARARYYDYIVQRPHLAKLYNHYDNTHFRCCGSQSLQWLRIGDFQAITGRLSEGGTRETFLDIGAGDSPDVLIAEGMGYVARSIDLFPPFKYLPNAAQLRERHIRADATRLPFDNYTADYISSQAMIALIPEHERTQFYKEACRTLKIGGWFSMTGARLKCGYGYRQGIETKRAREVGWWNIIPTINGFVAQREG